MIPHHFFSLMVVLGLLCFAKKCAAIASKVGR